MKVVINKCFGGFSLSARGVARMAELQGRQCFFYESSFKGPHRALTHKEAFASSAMLLNACDVPDIYAIPGILRDEEWRAASQEARSLSNKLYEAHGIENRPENRSDPLLVQVVEELGEAANGRCAQLAIVEIPDGVDYVIDEYDGRESIHEQHRSWS